MCVMMILLVLLQQGKGADAGAIVSSGSDSLFGPLGSGSPVSKLTTWLAIAFMLTSIFLVKAYNTASTRQSVTGRVEARDVLEGSRVAGEAAAAAAADTVAKPEAVKPAAEVPAALDKASTKEAAPAVVADAVKAPVKVEAEKVAAPKPAAVEVPAEKLEAPVEKK